MRPALLVYPMLAMVLLSFAVLLRLFRTRTRLVREGAVRASYFRIYQGDAEPEDSAKLARNFANLFEVPVLFYAGCLAAIATGQGSAFVLGLAWLYVALRVAHSFVHTGANGLRPRIALYFSSWIALLALWSALAVGVATSG